MNSLLRFLVGACPLVKICRQGLSGTWLSGKSFPVVPFVIFTAILSPIALQAATESGASITTRHMSDLVVQVGIILIAARLCGMLFEKLKLPSVLGELFAGILVGPYMLGKIPLPGFPAGVFPIASEALSVSEPLYGIATIASVILLFFAGLETDFALLLKFSLAGLLTGLGGVILSFAAGMAVGHFAAGIPLLHPISLFLGVMSTATSVGITVRILSDKRKLDTPEGVTILAAAVIDDIIGIILLAIVLGIVSLSTEARRGAELGDVGFIAFKAIGVWALFTVLGLKFANRIAGVLKRFKHFSILSILALAIAFIVAGIFEQAGLALIIGAYVTGLAFSVTDIRHVIEEQLHAIYSFVVPVFFAVMGMLINVEDLFSHRTIIIGTIFSVAAVVAKCLGCGAPALFTGFNLLGATRIGIGMVPRGEVALIIAGIGLSTGIISHDFFAIAVFMTAVTTAITPPVLSFFIQRPTRGTRKAVDVHGHVKYSFDFSEPELTSLLENRILDQFRREGFYVHLLDENTGEYHIQRDSSVIHLTTEKQRIGIETSEDILSYAKTLILESIIDLHATIGKIRSAVQPQELKKHLAISPGAHTSANHSENIPVLQNALVLMNLRERTKEGVLREFVHEFHKRGQLTDPEAAFGALWSRENLISTGMQHGVAIPHGRTEAVSSTTIAIGFKREGINFGALDTLPSTIFVCILYPTEGAGHHVELLAHIASKLNSPEKAHSLLTCSKSEDVLGFFLGSEGKA